MRKNRSPTGGEGTKRSVTYANNTVRKVDLNYDPRAEAQIFLMHLSFWSVSAEANKTTDASSRNGSIFPQS